MRSMQVAIDVPIVMRGKGMSMFASGVTKVHAGVWH